MEACGADFGVKLSTVGGFRAGGGCGYVRGLFFLGFDLNSQFIVQKKKKMNKQKSKKKIVFVS